MKRIQFYVFPRDYRGLGVLVTSHLPGLAGYQWDLEIRFGRFAWFIGLGKVSK